MKQILFSFFILFTGISVFAQDQKRQSQFNTENNLAVQGYDAVAYFTEGRAVKGSASFAVVYQGVRYYFSSSASKEVFKNNPSKYEPQYGGWCAYAMGATGEKVEIDPKAFNPDFAVEILLRLPTAAQ